jgi:hypothetical protein
MSLIFKSKTEMWSFVFPYLNFYNISGKRCVPVFSYLNFINESGTESDSFYHT